MIEGQTALVLTIPEAEAAVGRWRRRYDPVTVLGVPAHVTVLFPWAPLARVGPDDRPGLAGICAATAPIDITFSRLGRFPRTLWLDPEPPEPIRALTEAVTQRWPAYPPYGGEFADPVAHLTIADQQDLDGLDHVVEAVEAHLPVRAHVAELTLLTLRARRWTVDSAFRLGG